MHRISPSPRTKALLKQFGRNVIATAAPDARASPLSGLHKTPAVGLSCPSADTALTSGDPERGGGHSSLPSTTKHLQRLQHSFCAGTETEQVRRGVEVNKESLRHVRWVASLALSGNTGPGFGCSTFAARADCPMNTVTSWSPPQGLCPLCLLQNTGPQVPGIQDTVWKHHPSVPTRSREQRSPCHPRCPSPCHRSTRPRPSRPALPHTDLCCPNRHNQDTTDRLKVNLVHVKGAGNTIQTTRNGTFPYTLSHTSHLFNHSQSQQYRLSSSVRGAKSALILPTYLSINVFTSSQH